MAGSRLLELDSYSSRILSFASQEALLDDFKIDNQANLSGFTEGNSFIYNSDLYINLNYKMQNDSHATISCDFYVTTPIWEQAALEDLKKSANFMDDLCMKFVGENQFMEKFFPQEENGGSSQPKDLLSNIKGILKRPLKTYSIYSNNSYRSFRSLNKKTGFFCWLKKEHNGMRTKTHLQHVSNFFVNFTGRTLPDTTRDLDALFDCFELVGDNATSNTYGLIEESFVNKDVISEKVCHTILKFCRDEIYKNREALLKDASIDKKLIIRHLFDMYVAIHTYNMAEENGGNKGNSNNYEVSDVVYDIFPREFYHHKVSDTRNMHRLFTHRIMSKDCGSLASGNSPSKIIPSRVIMTFAQDSASADTSQSDQPSDKERDTKAAIKYFKRIANILNLPKHSRGAQTFLKPIEKIINNESSYDPENQEIKDMLFNIRMYFMNNFIISEEAVKGCDNLLFIMDPSMLDEPSPAPKLASTKRTPTYTRSEHKRKIILGSSTKWAKKHPLVVFLVSTLSIALLTMLIFLKTKSSNRFA